MNVAKLKELISELPDEMPVQLISIEHDDTERTIPIIDVFVEPVENDQRETIQALVISF